MPSRRPGPGVAVFAAVLAVLVLAAAHAAAQRGPTHLNRMIERLAAGEVVFGASTTNLSLDNAQALAISGLDYVYVDYEHGPMNFETLRSFLVGMIDKAAAVSKGSPQPAVTPLARFAPYGREQAEWAAKQGLDLGLMGVIFPSVETRQHVLDAVRLMRYPQRPDSPHPEPAGRRGVGARVAQWFWGVAAAEYVRRADVWPLNPDGDLLVVLLIESAEAVRNIDELLSVPGVGGVLIGPSDLSNSLGVARDSAETEAAIQTILRACLAHDVPCGVTAGADQMARRIEEGFRILGTGGLPGGLTASAAAALQAGREAVGQESPR